MEKEKLYRLVGFVVGTGWYNQTYWKKLEILTDEEGLKRIREEPRQDFLNFGLQSVDYAVFDVYEKQIEDHGDKVITVEYKEPIDTIEKGRCHFSKEEAKAFMQDWEIAVVEVNWR